MKTIRSQSGFSLIELMVSMTVLSLIVIGLLAVFNNMQRALRAANNQVDVFEGARATLGLVVRDINQLAAARDTNAANIYAADVAQLVLPRPGGGGQTNILQDLFFITHENDTWSGVGYLIDLKQQSDGVGTLYRFNIETNGPVPGTNWFARFQAARVGDTNVHRIADGIVHFESRAFDAKGRTYLGWPYGGAGYATNNLAFALDVRRDRFAFAGEALPAFVDVEFGVMEPQTIRQFNAINPGNAAAARSFLIEQVGKMHLFRQRIPIRNHIQPPALD